MFRAALAALEGWGRPTIPSRELLDYLGVNSVDEAIGIVYSAENPKALIAGFAPRVVEAARRGGVVALEILEDVAEAITSMLEAAARLSSCRRFCIVDGFYEGLAIFWTQCLAREAIVSRRENLIWSGQLCYWLSEATPPEDLHTAHNSCYNTHILVQYHHVGWRAQRQHAMWFEG